MQVTCTNCGESIPAENINIQKMVSVCPACNTVFSFDLPESKIKRRKIKQPKHLTLRNSDKLQMSFRTNFRLDRDEVVVGGMVMAFVFTFFALLTAGDAPLLIPLTFGLGSLVTYYRMALRLFNATTIEVEDDTIVVSRQPLPNPLDHQQEISLNNIVSVRCEETPKSIKEGYDTTRYNVVVETADGRRKVIVSDVIDDYGYFIAQRIQEYLELEIEPEAGEELGTDRDTSHLADHEPTTTPQDHVNHRETNHSQMQ